MTTTRATRAAVALAGMLWACGGGAGSSPPAVEVDAVLETDAAALDRGPPCPPGPDAQADGGRSPPDAVRTPDAVRPIADQGTPLPPDALPTDATPPPTVTDGGPPPAPDAALPDAYVPFACTYGDRVEIGTVAARDADGQPRLVETSGLMHSRRHPDVLWAHNDNGNDHRLFALNRDGTYLASYELDIAAAADIEGLAMGPGPIAGRNYLYLGDVGANYRIWGCSTANADTGDCAGCPTIQARCGGICDCRGRELRVFRTEEPAVAPGQAFVAVTGVAVETFVLRFPDGMLGRRQDVEAMMVDPRGGDLYLVTKHTTPALLLRAPAPLSTAAPNVLEIAGELPWGGESQATGGDISADGRFVGVRRYGDAYVWPRAPGATVAEAVAGEGCRIPAGEIQAESFAFDGDGSGSFFSLSESAGQATVPLYRYPRE